MAISRRVLGDGSVRWRVTVWTNGRGSERRIWTFDRKRDADVFEAQLRQRRAVGDLQLLPVDETLAELQADWLRYDALLNLQRRTLEDYAAVLDKHVLPRLGGVKLSQLTPQVVRRFRAELETEEVGRWTVRRSLVVLQAICRYGVEEERLTRNPVKAVRKPTGKRHRVVTVLAPDSVELIRSALLRDGRVGDAVIVSTLAYAGLRPQEALALEWRHVRARTLVVEKKNVDGRIMPGQKTGRPPRSIDLMAPLREDLDAWRQLAAINGDAALIFPTRSGGPWRTHDWKNWERRVWRPTATEAGVLEPPYSLRHSFASLQLYAGLTIVELAAQMGHSPAICLSTYQHVMADLKGTDASRPRFESRPLAAAPARISSS